MNATTHTDYFFEFHVVSNVNPTVKQFLEDVQYEELSAGTYE